MRHRIFSNLVLSVAMIAFASLASADEPKRTADDAVAAALKWLAAQQHEDGGWAFVAEGKPDDKAAESSAEATGLVLLAFLHAGQTHKEGQHKKTVFNGLHSLLRRMKRSDDKKSADLRGPDGNLVAHAIAATALCEAYAMTHDKELLKPAQLATNFIVAQQDEESGGWRAGEMSKPSVAALGWNLAALKAAHFAYLQIPPKAVLGAMKYLDAVQLEKGSYYASTMGQRDVQATAIGLCCRQTLGWKASHPSLVAGLRFINSDGPRQHDVLTNRFIDLVIAGSTRDTWDKWRPVMLKRLLDSQATEGEAAGSWFDAEDASAARGRLFQTAVNTLILRNSFPRFPRQESDDDEFPL
jgi:hypothetical protein